jgi:signal peptidase I
MIQTLIRLARRAVGLIWIALFVVLVAFSLLIHLAPLTGRQLFIISGGSMEPSMPLGSLVIASPIDGASIAVGDVVTVRAENGTVVTHRVTRLVALAEGRFVELRGDANADPDPSLVPVTAIIGRSNVHIPYAGYAQLVLSTLPGLVAAASTLLALVLVHQLLGMLARAAHPALPELRAP